MNFIVQKLISGRLFLTICAGIVFVYASFTKVLSPAEIVGVIMFVFTAYFSRNDRQKQKGGENE